jgi:hypothetical protein
LSRGVQVAGAACHAMMSIVVGVGDLVQRTRDGHTGQILGGRMIRRSGDAVCGLHRARGDEGAGILVVPQNQVRRFVSGLASKPLGRFLRFDLKPGGDGFLVEPQNQGGGGFPGLVLKVITTISWFGPQNQTGFGLLVVPQNRWREVGARHMSSSSGLLHVEASRVRVSQSGLKTSRGITVGCACGTITEVVSESS